MITCACCPMAWQPVSPLLVHCSSLWGQVATWFLHIVILWGWVYCVCMCVCAVCVRVLLLHASVVWLCTCESIIFLPCRHPERWLVTTSIRSFCPRARSSPCRDTPPVLGSSTPDNPPPLATTASLGLAPSRPNLRYSGHHGATSPLSSQGPCPLFIITTMGIPKARWPQTQMAAINRGCWSPCPVPCLWPDYRQRITTESNRRVWERELTGRWRARTQPCCSLITPTGP